ncbi:MAG: hypothetical protein HQL81_10560 [Magnetococcales bacterium]|nr:hypothetical protein [Magnetococcales bacterium]MBF0629598.1 hypothetical protein [Magnetococcales bacterium]
MVHDAIDAPIVLLDISGFDRLPTFSEKRNILERLQQLITQCAKPFVGFAAPWKVIPRHGTGDGYYFTMGAFPSPVAFRFVLDLKQRLTESNATHGDFPLRLRVALTLGDVHTVEDQLLSEPFVEAARLIDQPGLRTLIETSNDSLVLVVSALFMDNWRNHGERDDERLRVPKELPWVKTEYTDKHGKQWLGYLQTSPKEPPPPTTPIEEAGMRVMLLIGHSLEEPLPEAVAMANAFVRVWKDSKLKVELWVEQATRANLRHATLQEMDVLIFYGHGDETGRLIFADGPVGASDLKQEVQGLTLFWVFACHGTTFAKDLPCPWIAFSAPILQTAPQGLLEGWVRNLSHWGPGEALDEAITLCRPHMKSEFLDLLRTSPDLPTTPFPVGTPKLVWGSPHLFGHSCTDLVAPRSGSILYDRDDPFVGRVSLLKQLTSLPTSLGDQRRQRGIWIHGDAGMGKTAIVHKITAWIEEMAFHSDKEDPITVFQMNCWNHAVLSDLERELRGRLDRCYQLPSTTTTWDELFQHLERRSGCHVWILEDLTYLTDSGPYDKKESITERRLINEAGIRLAETLLERATRKGLTLHLVISARRPGPKDWEHVHVSNLEPDEARALAQRVMTNRWQQGAWPDRSLSGADRIFDQVGRSTALYKRALILAADQGTGFWEFSERMPQEMPPGAMGDLVEIMAQFELEQLAELESRYHFKFQYFLKICYSLISRAGYFSISELEQWFGNRFQMEMNTRNDTYSRAMDYLATLGFLATRSDTEQQTKTYILPPNQRLALHALAEAKESLPDVIPWRGVHERLALAMEGITSDRPDQIATAIAELQRMEHDFVRELDQPEPATAVFTSMNILAGIACTIEHDSLKEALIYDKILDLFDRHRASYGNADAPIVEQIARAMFNKGFMLGSIGKSAEAIKVYDDLLQHFAQRNESNIAELVAKAMVNKGVRLGSTGKNTEEIAVYDDLVQHFAMRDESVIAETIARAMYNKGFTLGSIGKSKEAIAVNDDLVRRFAHRDELGIAEQVARALFHKGIMLGSKGRNLKEIAVYNYLIRRFAHRDESGIAEQVAKAMVRKGIRLESMGHRTEAIAICNEVEYRFGKRNEPEIAEEVTRAKEIKKLLSEER